MSETNAHMVAGLQYLAEETVVTRDEALKALHPRGDMLLDALVNAGYARQARDDGRYAITALGLKKLAAEDPGEPDEDEDE